jgi:hypothetical protein
VVEEKEMLTELSLKIRTSRGKDTFGDPMVTLVVNSTGKHYRASGGGCDLYGTVVANYLEATYPDRLQARAREALGSDTYAGLSRGYHLFDGHLYGMLLELSTGKVTLTGGCGLISMIHIAKQIGIFIFAKRSKTSRTKWTQLIGFSVTDSGMPVAAPVVRSSPV